MQVFVSWSTETSRQLAVALRRWLPDVIQSLTLWVSSEDIAKGAQWNRELTRELDQARHGLICITPENQDAPWINFEAGALARTLEGVKVTPVLLGLAPHDMTGPLTMFQAAQADDRRDMFRLVRSLNEDAPDPLPTDRLQSAFERTWPEYVAEVEGLATAAAGGEESPRRPDSDMIANVLDVVRNIERALGTRPAPSGLRVLRARPEEHTTDDPGLMKVEATRELLSSGVLVEAYDHGIGVVVDTFTRDEIPFATIEFDDGETQTFEVEYYPLYVFLGSGG